MGKLEQIMIKAVQLESRGWTIHFGQKCSECGIPNLFKKYCTLVQCGGCDAYYVMDNPKLQATGGRQNGLARRVSD